jgi:BMFP domain-containing protein YqiC
MSNFIEELEAQSERELEAATASDTLEQRIVHLENAFRLAKRASEERRRSNLFKFNCDKP